MIKSCHSGYIDVISPQCVSLNVFFKISIMQESCVTLTTFLWHLSRMTSVIFNKLCFSINCVSMWKCCHIVCIDMPTPQRVSQGVLYDHNFHKITIVLESLWHLLHWNGFSLVCVFMCDRIFLVHMKAFVILAGLKYLFPSVCKIILLRECFVTLAALIRFFSSVLCETVFFREKYLYTFVNESLNYVYMLKWSFLQYISIM